MEFKYHYMSEESEQKPLSDQFIGSLMNYLEKRFPSFGDLDNGINSELRKYMEVGDGKDVTKVKKKIGDIVQAEKQRYLNKVRGRVEKIMVVPKKQQQAEE